MCYVRVELGSRFSARLASLFLLGAAVVAVSRANLIFMSAAMAGIGELSARHRDERAATAFNDFQVPDNKAVINGDRAESSQSVFRFFHQFDANLGDIQSPTLPDSSRFLAVMHLCPNWRQIASLGEADVE